MDRKNKSLLAFAEFRQNLKNSQKLQNGNERFSAHITYKYSGIEVSEILKVTFHLTTSMEACKIDIEEGEIITSSKLHLDFNAYWQIYEFLNENALLIRGTSKKIGNYNVILVEI